MRLRLGETKQIPLDIGFKFSKKLCCRIYPRPGQSVLPTFVGGGVIDADHRGNISVILTNFLSSNVDVKLGDRMAQIMFVRPEQVSFKEVKDFGDETVRGTKCFGSSGK